MASSSGDGNRVIDWDEAMEQCGGDEEFLRELLDDLRGEINVQVERIGELLQTRPIDWTKIMRAAHVIKGAAANLMCYQLRLTAQNMERSASLAGVSESAAAEVHTGYVELQSALSAFHQMLESLGI
mmetsp:Transcript_28096/g.56301  ORF Transcript_28096/g.56301 Transcript_28096/m.56301 type:complete len:127 (-) Transcript_28096:44-424(-)